MMVNLKRRRLAAANDALKKPFRSPVVQRDMKKDTTTDVKGHITPRKHSDQCTEASKPLSKQVPLLPVLQLRPGITTRKSKRRLSQSYDRSDSPFHSAIMVHQKSISREIRCLDEEDDKIKQAARIIDDDAARNGTDLDSLTYRWRAAARQAAEELFPIVKARYQDIGGRKGLRDMRERQRLFFGSLEKLQPENEEDQQQREPEIDEETDEFTMGIMLMAMNIDVDIVGFDIKQDMWIE